MTTTKKQLGKEWSLGVTHGGQLKIHGDLDTKPEAKSRLKTILSKTEV